jgi:N-acetylmuramoyl-L-alanine amidase
MNEIKQFYSQNFDPIKRKKANIKFLVFHYTGMKTEKSALKRLSSNYSKVSCHYFIKKNGDIINLVPDLYVSWHAGISRWKKLKKLNKFSIGIEIHNPGHQYGYKRFNKKQINSLKNLSLKLAKKYNLKSKHYLGHSDIAPDRKKDPGEKFPWEFLSKYKIGVWHSLDKRLLKKYRLKNIDNLDKIIFFRYLTKIGYFFKKKKINSILFAIKAFQRRFRPQLINGKIDFECLEIAKNLVKSGFN